MAVLRRQSLGQPPPTMTSWQSSAGRATFVTPGSSCSPALVLRAAAPLAPTSKSTHAALPSVAVTTGGRVIGGSPGLLRLKIANHATLHARPATAAAAAIVRRAPAEGTFTTAGSVTHVKSARWTPIALLGGATTTTVLARQHPLHRLHNALQRFSRRPQAPSQMAAPPRATMPPTSTALGLFPLATARSSSASPASTPS
mmetsp:Transcript_32779/g.104436  ORF Transcript_32779/g.104436 Transcript_32779/m.104436 type:complete len:200 (-) Transcript_32779:284-883(-)